MRLPALSVVCLLPFLLSACMHKNNHAQVERLAPPIEDAPPPRPMPSPTNLPPPVITEPNMNTTPEVEPPLPAHPKPPVKHRKPAPKNTEVAANETPSVSAIGQLSVGDPNDLQQQTLHSIGIIERGLGSITRTLNDQEQMTAAQIREFIKQARVALSAGDVDGAHTLAVKAQVLLGELSR